MTALEFPGPGLSAEQWQQISTLAVSVRPGQALWISGYFAGLEHGARSLQGDALVSPSVGGPQAGLATPVPSRTLTILFGSETGNGGAIAGKLADSARVMGLEPVLSDMADYKPRRLKDEQDVLLVTSTHGEGDPPLSAVGFFEFIEGRKAPRLDGTRFAVLALGDSTYEFYCGAGKRLDTRLAELGAERLQARVDCDVDYDEPAANWIGKVLGLLSPSAVAPASSPRNGLQPAQPAGSIHDRRHPFTATVLENIALTGRGSSKETRHIELSLEGAGLAFEPGDALGVIPRNDPAIVATLIDELGLAGDEPLALGDRQLSLEGALTEALEITTMTPRFLEHWAELSGASELQDLRGEEVFRERMAFLQANHVIDIVRRFPVSGIAAADFVAGLRPLQPRLYSIASSAVAVPDEVHLTVSTVRYTLNGEPRSGLVSGHFSERAAPDTEVPVYVQSNPHFRLPDDDTPIIMIGAGTGVAPYRAFLQEREIRGSGGKSWLFFGERNFDSDFLYQTEWQGFLKDDVLTRMNIAFSRDGSAKTYVQHRLLENARDVYGWLEEGAHLYVCGDGKTLAPDVHATLLDILQQQAGIGKAAASEYLGAMQASHRYQMDVY